MERNIEFKALEPNAQINQRIERLITQLDKTAKTFSPELTHLRVFVEYIPAHTLYNVSLTLRLPGKTLAAKAEQHDLKAGLRTAFEELEHQVKKYRENLRGEHRKRPARRQEIPEAKTRAALSEEIKREAFFSLITPHLNRLYRFVRHVISYAEAMGDLIKDKLTPEEVVDGTLLRAYREFIKGRTPPDLKAWLIRLALDQHEADVTRLAIRQPQTEEVSTLGEEILDHYEPDEDLKLDNLLPAMMDVQTPEGEVERQALRQVVRKTFMEMPRSWRRVLLLKAMEGLSRREIAKELGRPEPGIEQIARSAREYVRQRVAGAGYHFKVREERAA
jgi:RNA polymerase sigma factor (sigma-70 family)